ncbi:hypothetical protein SteCoe_25533 [Stentor coeruleus]|uniref:Bromo domain-containing protein n=1 Tax=Stentor coeruleus TaxID=5963 RepID=A0A1R2BEZ2_9CILI|nr:hypothetical protein SteCoe_25533 [Stentor coeruleus]
MDNKTKADLLGVIRALSMLPCARPFLKPVDYIALNIPDYIEIISKPMDLGTIKKKLNTKHYESTDDYLEDIYLIFENCRKYNTDPRNPIRILCEDLQTQFEIQWKMYLDRKKADQDAIKIEEKLPTKREVEYIEIKKSRRAKAKDDEKERAQLELEKELERERIREEKERQREERERLKEERAREREIEREIEWEREREQEKERKKEREKERERQIEYEREKEREREIEMLKELENEKERTKNEIKVKVRFKEPKKPQAEVEYQDELNFDKLTGKSDFDGIIKLKVPEPTPPEDYQADNPVPAKLESIEYMRAALLPLVDPISRPLLRNTLLNAIFTVAHLQE